MSPQRKWSLEARKAKAARIHRDEARLGLVRHRAASPLPPPPKNMSGTQLVLVLGGVVATGYVVGKLFGVWRKSAAEGVHGLSDLRSVDLVGLDVLVSLR